MLYVQDFFWYYVQRECHFKTFIYCRKHFIDQKTAMHVHWYLISSVDTHFETLCIDASQYNPISNTCVAVHVNELIVKLWRKSMVHLRSLCLCKVTGYDISATILAGNFQSEYIVVWKGDISGSSPYYPKSWLVKVSVYHTVYALHLANI